MGRGHKPRNIAADSVPAAQREHSLTADPPARHGMDWRGSIIGAFLGAIAFFTILGHTPLIFSNIGWLKGGDPATYYLSAAFFQQSPWTFPPGLNPQYGMEIPSAIMYGDAIPLFAFVFKILHAFTGQTVQFVGLWVLACFVLQGLFGWLLGALFTDSNTIKLSVALLLIFMPVFLAPTLQLAGYPISGQFLLLAAIVLYFATVDRRRRLLWTGLTVVAILCNPYLFAMVFGVWCADVVARAWRAEQTRRYLAIEVSTVIPALLLTLWLSGFFVMGSGHESGWFGMFRANLLSMFDSKPGHLTWSYFLPPTPKVSPYNNAPNFMGSGLLLLVAAAGLVCLERRSAIVWNRRVYPLAGAAVLMFLYSLSNRVSIGSFEIVIPIGGTLQRVANLFSVSGRFMWPLLYLAAAGAIHVISAKTDRRAACALFVAAAGLQVADTHAAWGGSSERIAWNQAESWRTSLNSPFWERAGRFYGAVRTLPIVNRKPRYDEVAYFALTHGMRTNAVYLARIDKDRIARENDRFVQELHAARLNPKTLYLLDDSYLENARRSATPDDLLETIDGVLVLAPRWQSVSGCRDKSASPESRRGCPAIKVPGAPLPLDGLRWQVWGPARADTVRAEISSETPVDSALVGSQVLQPGSYLVTACMSWDVQGPPAGAAHVSIQGIRKLIEIPTSREQHACRSAQAEIPSAGSAARIAFGLGGWSTGKGRIRMEKLTIQPLVAAQ